MNRNHVNKSLSEKSGEFTDYIRAVRYNKKSPALDKPEDLYDKEKVKKYDRDFASSQPEYNERVKFHKLVSKQSMDTQPPPVQNNEVIPTQEKPMNTHKVRKMPLPKKAEEAFALGFVKAAIDKGIKPLTAIDMLKLANLQDVMENPQANDMIQKGISHGAIGALGGAGIGGLGGYMMGKSKDPAKDHSTRDAVLGALGGGALGGGVGAYHGANEAFKQDMVQPYIDIMKQQQDAGVNKYLMDPIGKFFGADPNVPRQQAIKSLEQENLGKFLMHMLSSKARN